VRLTQTSFGRILSVLLLVCLVASISAADFQPDRNLILGHLNAVISWYREVTGNLKPGEMPSDAIFQQNVRGLAAQSVQLAFEAARAEAALLSESSAPPDAGGAPAQNYGQMQERISQRITDNQAKLDALEKQIASQSGVKRKDSIAQRDSLSGQIELDKAMSNAIEKMSAFVELSAVNKQGLEGSIDELASSIPEVLAKPGAPSSTTQKPAQTASPTTAKSGGLIGQLFTLYDQVQTLRAIDHLRAGNIHAIQAASNLRDPVRGAVRSIISQGQQEMPAPGNESVGASAGANPAPQPQDFAKLTKQFNQLAAAFVPLSQEILLLQECQSNLEEWHSSIASESKHDLIALLLRVFAIALALAVVWGLSEIWRRLTFRYVNDARRRRQFLVLRRFVMGFFFAMVIVMGFVSEFGSLATYAGFVTAGIAVGLQTLLLSVAAYFFVVGRYGIRIGDRISVAGVTGDVVDVGLVRLYIMELAGTGVDLYPTGRIAVFSNSVLFQPMTPLYKQVPGTEYAWHEALITIAATGNQERVREKSLAAVNSVYNEYREILERQQGTIGDRMEIILNAPAPEARFQFNDDGMVLIIRYPVLLARASEIDDRVAQALAGIIASEGGEVSADVAGKPKIRAAVKG
jgi:small-conductance mechanosensitive channel